MLFPTKQFRHTSQSLQSPNRQITWKLFFKRSLYRQNYNYICSSSRHQCHKQQNKSYDKYNNEQAQQNNFEYRQQHIFNRNKSQSCNIIKTNLQQALNRTKQQHIRNLIAEQAIMSLQNIDTVLNSICDVNANTNSTNIINEGQTADIEPYCNTVHANNYDNNKLISHYQQQQQCVRDVRDTYSKNNIYSVSSCNNNNQQNALINKHSLSIEYSQPHPSPYNNSSVYMPILKNIHSDNQLINTYYYMKMMAHRNQQYKLDVIYDQIQDFMTKCKKMDAQAHNHSNSRHANNAYNAYNNSIKQQNYVNRGWRQCLLQFLPSLDVIATIQLYVCLIKHGYNYQFVNFVTSEPTTRKVTEQNKVDKDDTSKGQDDGDDNDNKADNEYRMGARLLNNPYKQGKTNHQLFIQKLVETGPRYLNKQYSNNSSNNSNQYNRTLQISIQSLQSINWCTISKTMKMLFCSVCLVYDCGKHQLGLQCQKRGYHYRSKPNANNGLNLSALNNSIIAKLRDVLTLCYFQRKIRQQQQQQQDKLLQKIVAGNNNVDDNDNYITADNVNEDNAKITDKIMSMLGQSNSQKPVSKARQNQCGQNCYKLLTKSTYRSTVFMKTKYLTPINISLIDIGIQMFSYRPCMIYKLFHSNSHSATNMNVKPKINDNNQFTCAMIFSYLFQQKNLLATLQNKLCPSQISSLLKQNTGESYCNILLPDGQPEMGASSPNILLQEHNLLNMTMSKSRRHQMMTQKQGDRYQQAAVCMHHFLALPSGSSAGTQHQQYQSFIDPQCLNCQCTVRGFCLPECQCTSQCPIMVRGCNCARAKDNCRSAKCSCYRNRTQCIPGICGSCYEGQQTYIDHDNNINKTKTKTKLAWKKNACTNDQIIRGKNKIIRIGPSKIKGAGLGAFAGQKIKANQLITTYSGQILQPQMQTIRQIIKKGQQFYNFASSQGSIDARYMGNKSRFINHASQKQGKTNVVSLNVYSMAQQFIALYAQKDIEVGDQLLFDYQAQGLQNVSYLQDHPFLYKDTDNDNGNGNDNGGNGQSQVQEQIQVYLK